MEVRAVAKQIRISPRKVRLVADAVRNVTINEAFRILEAAEQQAARPLVKVLKSAVANAVNNAKLDSANLVIASLQVNDGQVFKRFRPSTRGRIHPYKKRGSTIAVVLKEKVVAKQISKVEKQKPVVKATVKKEKNVKGEKE